MSRLKHAAKAAGKAFLKTARKHKRLSKQQASVGQDLLAVADYNNSIANAAGTLAAGGSPAEALTAAGFDVNSPEVTDPATATRIANWMLQKVGKPPIVSSVTQPSKGSQHSRQKRTGRHARRKHGQRS